MPNKKKDEFAAVQDATMLELDSTPIVAPAIPERIPQVNAPPSVELGAVSIEAIEEGLPIRFEYRGKTYLVRPFLDSEYDDAMWLQSAVQSKTELMPELSDMQMMEAHDWAKALDVESRAAELALMRGLDARDRYLIMHCLCDENGKELMDRDDPKSVARYHRIPRPVKDLAQQAIWKFISAYRDFPFV